MQLARTFLRIAALEALRPSALLSADAPQWPTLAQKLVFDSALDPIDDLSAQTRKPVIVVYTGDDNLDPLDQHGDFIYSAAVELMIEISVIAGAPDAENPDLIVPGTPVTDAELEAALDLLEAQIFYALHYAAEGAAFRKLCNLPFKDWRSLPHRTSEENARLAMRTIRARVPLKNMCYPRAGTGDPLTGTARLPQPLRQIAEALGESTYYKALTDAFAASAPASPPAAPLAGVTMNIEAMSPPAVESGDADIVAQAENLQG